MSFFKCMCYKLMEKKTFYGTINLGPSTLKASIDNWDFKRGKSGSVWDQDEPLSGLNIKCKTLT